MSNASYGKRKYLYKLIKESPSGITTDELIKAMKCSKNCIYNHISMLNKNTNNLEIYSKKQKYYLREESTQKTINNIIKNNTPKKNVSTVDCISNPKIIAKLKTLPVSDMNDILDMLKKSFYYKKSAEALIEANEMINILMEQLNY